MALLIQLEAGRFREGVFPGLVHDQVPVVVLDLGVHHPPHGREPHLHVDSLGVNGGEDDEEVLTRELPGNHQRAGREERVVKNGQLIVK